MSIEPGQRLLHYRLIGKIGEGGMGVVWKAEDTRLGRFVALKLVPEEATADESQVDRHLREARAASALNHPHICSIYDIGEWDSRRFIVMELLEGGTLREFIGDQPMDTDRVVELGLQIADALDAAHAKGIVHRDVKTTNIFVVDGGRGTERAKVLDFGLAKLTDLPANDLATDAPTEQMNMTRPGSVVGTVSYMSPEQALGKPLDHRSDIFSLGAVLYEMLTGRQAFEGGSSAAVFDAILNRAPTPPTAINPAVSEELQRIVSRAMEKNVDLRYQSVGDLHTDLRRLRESTSGGIATPPPQRHRSSPWRPIVAALVIATSGWVLWQARDLSEPGEAKASEPPPPIDTARAGGPSLAVLPFTNASGDPEQEYFSDGLTLDVIAELSGYKELSVLSRSSTARHKNSVEDVRKIGADLGARYVLQGTVRRAGSRLRISVELSDALDGRSVWGDHYERDLTARDLFELQDDLTQQVVNAIAGSYGALTRAELPRARRRQPASLDAYDCVLRVYEYLQVHTGENQLAARECLEPVVEEDPDYAEGAAWLAYLTIEEWHHRRHERPELYDSRDRALELATRAAALDTATHVTHGVLMLTHFLRGEPDKGRIEAFRTIELSPNNSLWLALVGVYLAQIEDFENGMPMAQRAIELSPHPPGWYEMASFHEAYRAHRYDEALEVARGLDLTDDFRGPLFTAAAYGQLGRVDEAVRELDLLLEMWEHPPGELRQEFIERHAFSPDLTDHLLEGLELAGLEGVGQR